MTTVGKCKTVTDRDNLWAESIPKMQSWKLKRKCKEENKQRKGNKFVYVG